MKGFRHFFSHWQNWVSTITILLFVVVAIAAPLISPDDPKEPGPFMQVGKATRSEPLPPDDKAILGMLPRGIDVFHALVWGSRDALQFGLIVTVSTALFGVLYGAIAGIAASRVSNLMLRVADAFLAFPPIAGLVFLQQLFATTITAMGGFYFTHEFYGRIIEIKGPMTAIQFVLERVNPLMLSLIVFSWMPYARLIHSIVLTLQQTDFVQAAWALGGSPFWIVRKHLLPNSIGPAIVLAARDVGGVVLLQATLTFIQLGGDSVWGAMLSLGRNWVIGPGGNLLTYWWVFLPPTMAVMVFGIAWNMLGDGLSDAFTPGARVEVREELAAEINTPAVSKDTRPVARLAAPTLSLPAVIQEASPPQLRVHRIDKTNGGDPTLTLARQSAANGDLSRALHCYDYLIQRGRSIDLILTDLAIMVKQYPRDPQIWQALGDALTRAGDAMHAGQSYERAEKLRQ